ncbi:WG repeat-containing protein [Larkinella rosea]|uniref:WG repeat-containing protein n=1 Tax=Larkinella rosea TaxID=2025312 RepID=A0A3P1B9F4_9BACT|nr:WG repeat-containing protein [Larkinella rosea]RRA97668.1 WG repeat-containing protein [Larkinella rosea]
MIDTIRQKIEEVFGPDNQHVPADVINRLFVATSYDEVALTQEIMGYLLEHNYEALKTPKGQSLREQLISTDWRQKETKKWASEPSQPHAMPATSSAPAHPIQNRLDQSNRVLIVFVLLIASVLLWLWNGKLSEIDNGAGQIDATETESEYSGSSVQTRETLQRPNTGTSPKKTALPPASQKALEKNNNHLISAVSTAEQLPVAPVLESPVAVTGSKVSPYDSIDNHVGDFGLRAARKGGKWGYVNQKDQWHIDPVYDDVTPFLNGKATVVLDGQQIVIDRDGARIRDES